MYETILVPTDGSDRAETVVEIALDTANQHGATLHALYVVDTSLYGEPALSSTELLLSEDTDAGSELLDAIVTRAAERGVEAIGTQRHGTPHEVILGYADEIDADLLVMGYQGTTHEVRRGNVVTAVLDETDRRVLVV